MSSFPKRICLFERDAARLEPLAAVKPVWELRAGAHTLLERLERVFPEAEIVLAGRAALVPLNDARVGSRMAAEISCEDTLFLDAGVALGREDGARIAALVDAPCRIEVGGVFAGAYLPGASPVPGGDEIAEVLDAASRGEIVRPLDVTILRSLPDFITHLDQLVTTDAVLAGTAVTVTEGSVEGVRVLGEFPVRVDRSARIDPGTTLDARHGPISIGSEAVVSFNTWLVGPASIGRRSQLLGGTLGPLIGIGPVCRVRGEVAESFFQGYTNKAHDGFIGHSVLGEWVNLGAMTTCSDLKNNYSTIRLAIAGRSVDTRLTKLGVFIGDHAKTAIGTLLSTGSVIGVGANVFGFDGLSPKEVPAFAWGKGSRGSYSLERFLEVAEHVMQRRGVSLDEATRARLAELHAG